jgi:hypothetical protein
VTVQHGEGAGYVKSADCDRYTSGPEWASDIESAGILVRLHSDQRDKSEIAVTPETGDE